MKKLKIKSLLFLSVLLALILLVLSNVFISELNDRFGGLTADLTESNLYNLDETTINQLSNLTKNISIMVLAKEEDFVSPTKYNSHANEIFKLFEKNSPNITLSYVDYISNPTFSLDYPKVEMKHGDILVVSEENHSLIPTEKLFNYETTQQGGLEILSSRAEQAVSETISKVTSGKTSLGIVTAGHLEKESASFTGLLANSGFEVKSANLLMEEIPADSEIIFIIAPQQDFNEVELKKLSDYLKTSGKNVFYFADAASPSLPALESFLKEWGISVDIGLVFETDEQKVFQYQPFYPQVSFVGAEPFSALSSIANPIIMPISKPLSVLYANNGGYSTNVLTEFGTTAGVRPSGADETFTAEQAQAWGPLPSTIASSYRKSTTSDASNLVVFSSAEMISDSFVEGAVFGNSQFILQLMATLTQKEDVLIIPPKTLRASSLGISKSTTDLLGVVFVFVIPLSILAAGAFVWLGRRNK